jgi:parallel beta-helix repeat protein
MKSKAYTAFPALACLLLFSTAAFAQGVGAVTPFTSYEAEAGTVGGGATIVSLTSAPTTEYSSPTLEASGHSYVQLSGPGQFVQWTNNTGQPITFINVRESIPDAPTGGGMTATLDLYVNGVFRQALNLNSIQSWLYEGNGNYEGNDQNPADGDPRVFYDESHTFITGAPIAPGSTFSLQEDASNTAKFYYIDVIDVENPPAPLTQPANSISITSCGAVADNNPTNGSADSAAVDSTAAIQNCINQAQSQGKILWIPQGIFYLKGTTGLQAQGITIEGAGMWYSTIYRDVPLPNSMGLAAAFSVTSCTMENLHIDSNALSRATVDGAGGAMDTTGTNWLANGMWNQHVESGCWASGTGGTVENSRFTSIWADGCNLNNVSLTGTVGNNLTEMNNFVRGTGDDALAINSVDYNVNSNGSDTYYTAMSNITLINNTSIAPWGGKGIGIYGGTGHHVENNYISDTPRYIGLGVGRFGVNGSDLHTPTVTGNVVVRSGGNAYNQGQPALQIGNGGDGQSVGIVDGATVTGNTVIDSVYDGIGFSTSTNTLLENNTVTSPWRNGIVIDPPFYPAPTGSATITDNTVTGITAGHSAFINNSSGFVATLSGNSWQETTPEAPYGGTPAAIPGTVLAENYDTGGQGVAYNVTSVNGTDNSYRSDGVDLETATSPATGNDLGWTATGQWFRYTVNVATAGTYNVTFEVAAPSAVTDAFHIANATGTNLSGSINIPATGGFQTWTTVTATVTLPAGQQVLTLDQDNGGWNIDSVTFALPAAATPTFSLAAGTYTGAQSVTISASTSGATIYFTTNGTAPTTSSALYSAPITVSATETLEAITVASGYNNSAVAIAVYTITAPAEGPYGGTAAAIPGTVKAENYDTGGQGIAYNVTSVNGTDNSYRSDGVDLETATSPATGNDLGWTASGQWFKYTVNVATAGTYTVSFLLAAPSAITDAFHISNASGANLTGSVNIPETGGWQTWTTITITVTLPAGVQTLTLNEDNAGWNIDTAAFALANAPFGGTPAAIPGTVKAENYDTGGQGVAYNVTSVNGTDNSYRSDGVDLETATSPATGNDLGWTASGQWFKYTVNVATAGTYTVTFEVASPSGVTDGFHLSNSSGTNLTGSVNVTETGGWQDWTTATATVALPAGLQVLTLNEDNAGWNIDYAAFALQ